MAVDVRKNMLGTEVTRLIREPEARDSELRINVMKSLRSDGSTEMGNIAGWFELHHLGDDSIADLASAVWKSGPERRLDTPESIIQVLDFWGNEQKKNMEENPDITKSWSNDDYVNETGKMCCLIDYLLSASDNAISEDILERCSSENVVKAMGLIVERSYGKNRARQILSDLGIGEYQVCRKLYEIVEHGVDQDKIN
ncbi:hypothetical protein HYV64_05500 [Candidatus Shapirobacteria bacterium]|nr:hypothetical protein [Candidatus Shapirobacteria bacterium]